MSDEEIMQKFNEQFSDQLPNDAKKKEEAVAPYRVSNNFNTVNSNNIANFQNSSSEKNILENQKNIIDNNTNNNVTTNSNFSNFNTNDAKFINNSSDNLNNNSSFSNTSNYVPPSVDNIVSDNTTKYDTNVSYNYVPTYSTKKSKKSTFKLTNENLVFIVIVVILFVFILIMPSIYDFIREIKMR